MRVLGLAVALLLVLSTPVFAQTATPSSHLNWDQVGQSVAVATATGVAYNSYADASTTAVPLSGVGCVAGTPASTSNCTGNFPALTPGNHTLTLTQAIAGVESAKSSAISFAFVVVVTPQNFKIVRLFNVLKGGGALTSRGRYIATHQHVVRDLRRIQ